MVLASALCASVIWWIVDAGLVDITGTNTVVYLVEFALCAVLAAGVSWSHIRRRITGQIDVDEADI